MDQKPQLANFIVKEAIVNNLAATGKEEAIREIIASLVAAGQLKAAESADILAAIMKREELGSTGIGMGVAVPHAKHHSVSRMVGTVAVSKKKIDFASIDREPVDILFLLVSPPEQPGEHLKALELISRHLRNDTFRRFLRQSAAKEDIAEVLDEADQGKLV